MNIKSLGYRTDFIFNKFDGEVTEFENYYLVKTDNNPHYFWGNLLLFKEAPLEGDYKKWTSYFHKEFKKDEYFHMTFGWDSPDGNEGQVEEFLKEGFSFEKSVVLSTTELIKPPKFNDKVNVEMITSDDDFEKSIKIQVDSAHDHLSKESWESFYRKQAEQYKKMIEAGLGHWFGAWLDGKLVGSLGVFKDGDVGRFQIVSTDPNFQRRGVCSSLVYNSAKYALENMKLKKLVMVADDEYHAAKIYESVGFRPTEYMAGLCWWDKEKHS
jgi:ribosomal protein S18 acetylase RimI-like enzyme